LVELATGSRTQLTPDDGSAVGPVFSPDGKWIAFLASDVGDAFEVAIIRPDGSGLQKLTGSADAVTHVGDAVAPISNIDPYPALFWDADGTGLTFMRDTGESAELWHVTVDGRIEQRIGTHSVSEFAK
jgi:tricorn protease